MMFGPSSAAPAELAERSGMSAVEEAAAAAVAEDSQCTGAAVGAAVEEVAGSFVEVPVQDSQYIAAANVLG